MQADPYPWHATFIATGDTFARAPDYETAIESVGGRDDIVEVAYNPRHMTVLEQAHTSAVAASSDLASLLRSYGRHADAGVADWAAEKLGGIDPEG